MENKPKITILKWDDFGLRCRIEGGVLAPEWAKSLHPGRTAWCEFSLMHGSENIGSYGGEVWPSAWPALFGSTASAEWPRGTAQCPDGLRLTAEGKDLVDAEKRRWREFRASLNTQRPLDGMK